MITRPLRRHVGHPARTVALVVLGVVALAGCGGDPDDPSGAPTPATSTTGKEPSDGTASGTGDRGVEPATGEEVSSEHVTLRIPEDWKVKELISSVQIAEPRRLVDSSSLTITDQEAPGDAESLDVIAQRAVRLNAVPAPGPEALDPVEVAGVEVYHLAGRNGTAQYVEEFGPAVDDALVSLNFSISTLTPRAEREEIIQSILATVEWNL